MQNSEIQRRNFDVEATVWDTPSRVQLAQDITTAMFRHVSLTEAMDVMDFGCGTGLVSLALAPRVKSVLCLDSSEGMLTVLKQKAGRIPVSNVRGLVTDLENDPLPQGPFDLVVSSMTLHHIRDIANLFRKLRSVLKSGGRLVLADLEKEDGSFHGDNTGVFHFGFDRKRLQGILYASGFETVSFFPAARMSKAAVGRGERLFEVFLLIAG